MKKILMVLSSALIWAVNPAVLLVGCSPSPFDGGCPPIQFVDVNFEANQVQQGMMSIPRNQIVQLDDFSMIEVVFSTNTTAQRPTSTPPMVWPELIQSAHAECSVVEYVVEDPVLIAGSLTVYRWTREAGRGEEIFSAGRISGEYTISDVVTFDSGESMFGGELQLLQYTGPNFFIDSLELTTDSGTRIISRKHLFDVASDGSIIESGMDEDMGILDAD